MTEQIEMFSTNVIPSVSLWCDGASSPNPGFGGWGTVLIFANGDRKELSGSKTKSSNNQMEITAVLEGLRYLHGKHKVTVYSDSSYVVNAFKEGWIQRWKTMGWKRKEGPLLNSDLWQALYGEVSKHEVEFVWVKGHAGNIENERADQLAVEARLKLAEETENA